MQDSPVKDWVVFIWSRLYRIRNNKFEGHQDSLLLSLSVVRL